MMNLTCSSVLHLCDTLSICWCSLLLWHCCSVNCSLNCWHSADSCWHSLTDCSADTFALDSASFDSWVTTQSFRQCLQWPLSHNRSTQSYTESSFDLALLTESLENVGCHKVKQDKKRRNQKKSKPTRDSSRSDKKAMSHVVWPRVKNVWRQTASQSITLLYTGNKQQRSSMQEVDQ